MQGEEGSDTEQLSVLSEHSRFIAVVSGIHVVCVLRVTQLLPSQEDLRYRPHRGRSTLKSDGAVFIL